MKAPPWMNKDEANAWQIGFEMGQAHLPDLPQAAPLTQQGAPEAEDLRQFLEQVACGFPITITTGEL